MRLHLGCGSVYLSDDWINIDLPLPHVFLAKERPDLVKAFSTTESNYYGRHADKSPENLRAGPVTKDTVCDVYGSFGFLPVRSGTASTILSRQAFEHLSREEAHKALSECRRALQIGGTLRIDVPDPDETVRMYRETGDVFYLRHLFGPRRDTYGFHTHWTRKMLIGLARQHGFDYVQERPNIHTFYPAYELEFSRA